jgi:hypothetical protein
MAIGPGAPTLAVVVATVTRRILVAPTAATFGVASGLPVAAGVVLARVARIGRYRDDTGTHDQQRRRDQSSP